MVKHTQTIRRQIPDKLFDHFVGLTLEELNTKQVTRKNNCFQFLYTQTLSFCNVHVQSNQTVWEIK